MVLGLLEAGPQHGYQLIRSFAQRSADAYSPSPGVLYPLLTLLADMGLVEETPGEGSRRNYRLTETGKAQLNDKRAELEVAFARLAALGDDAAKALGTIARAKGMSQLSRVRAWAGTASTRRCQGRATPALPRS